MRLTGIASVVATAPPTFAVQSSAFAGVTRPVIGQYDLALVADQGQSQATRLLLALTRIGPAFMLQNAFGVIDLPGSDVVKRVQTLRETAGGSTFQDQNFDVALVSLDEQEDFQSIVGAGSVRFVLGVPEYVFQGGALTSFITDVGPGDINANLLDARGVAAADCVILATPRRIGAATTDLRTIDTQQVSDFVKKFRLLAGDPGAAAADFAFDFVILSVVPPVGVDGRLIQTHSWLQVTGATGAVINNGGAVSTVTRTAAGRYTIDYVAGNGLDFDDGAFVALPNSAAGLSSMRTCEIEHVSAIQKLIAWRQESAGGGASAFFDTDFCYFAVSETGS
jgi:hypothetical protein